MWLVLYNLFLPAGFLFFLPGLIFKYRTRPGWKETYRERFGRFSPERRRELEPFRGCTWLHAVSVGETVAAAALLKAWRAAEPDRKFVLSTTTTTGQELARRQAPQGVAVIFCPIDFRRWVRRTLDVVRPELLVIFETEIWPNLIMESRRRDVPVALVNARLSDHSAKWYRRARVFFRPLLEAVSLISAQSDDDAARFRSIAPDARVAVAGNIKFDQTVPPDLEAVDYLDVFGGGAGPVLLGASTHAGEEELLIRVFGELLREFPDLRLVLVPRHAERGEEIAAVLRTSGLRYRRRSDGSGTGGRGDAQVLLADTTGEMLRLMKGADIVFMGKSLAGHDEGHNLIEPALLNKPIVTGAVLRNFRFVLRVLEDAEAVRTVASDDALAAGLRPLVADPGLRGEMGVRAGEAIRRHAGATARTIEWLRAVS